MSPDFTEVVPGGCGGWVWGRDVKPYYEDGSVTIYHGDCREWLVPIDAPCAIVTDPPYGIGAKASVRRSTKWQRTAGMPAREWDNETPLVAWLLDMAPTVAIWGGNYFALPPSRGWLAWCKPDAPPSMGSVELCWTNVDRTAKHVVHSISATNSERCGHPTQKPLAVMLETIGFIRLATGTLIVDPYCGSGTTLRAAKDLGFRSIGIEQNEAYCEIAAERCRQETLFGAA